MPQGDDQRQERPALIEPSGRRRRLGRWHWPRWLPPPKVVAIVGIVVAFGVLCYRLRGEFATALHRVSPAGLPWLAAAVAAEIASFLCYAGVQRRLLAAGGARLPRRTMVSLTVAATGLTNLVPGGTAPASGWLVSQYRRHGVPLPLALWAVIAGGYAAGASVLLLLLCGATVAGLLGVWTFAGFLVLLGVAAAAGVAASHHLPTVRRWLDRLHLPGVGPLRRLADRSGHVLQFRARVGGGLVVYLLSIGNWGLDVMVLASGFLVLHLPVPWTALLFAYATGQVAGALAPLPGGIGFVEGGMIGALTAAGTPAGDAILATLVYRLITTVGMAGIGSAALFVVNHREPHRAVLHGNAATLARQAADRQEPSPDGHEPDDRSAGSAGQADGGAGSPPGQADDGAGSRPEGADGGQLASRESWTVRMHHLVVLVRRGGRCSDVGRHGEPPLDRVLAEADRRFLGQLHQGVA